jgi:serine protease
VSTMNGDQHRAAGDVDPPLPYPADLRRHRARQLDPLDALLLPGQRLRPTVYVADELLVPRSASLRAVRDTLGRAAEALRLELRPAPPGEDERLPARVTLVPPAGSAGRPDAWAVLQTARATEPGEVAGVGLNHLLSVTLGGVIGQHEPNGSGPALNAFAGASARAEYGLPGWGGRAPVEYLGPTPRRRDRPRGRRPVVAVLDMGAGLHPWLPDDIVERAPTLSGRQIGLGKPGTERPFTGGPLDGTLHWAWGHPTFVCGLIRQVSPDADILSVKVVEDDGLVDEWSLAAAMADVYELARRHQQGEPDGSPVDVVSLSLGFYPEQLDAGAGELLREAIRDFGSLGIPVVASAGNDATRRELAPAAWSPELRREGVQLISVGALNPDRTVALFSNAGPWVERWEPGVALVSTVPAYNGGANASAHATADGRERRSFDPDNYRHFATWSGTSFAAPIRAARIAERLLERSEGDTSLDLPGPEAAARRAAAAVAALID